MNLLEKIDMFLLSEAKVSISPYLKSVMKKQDAYTGGEEKDIIKSISKAKTNATVSIAISTPYTDGKKYVIVKSNDDNDIDEVSARIAALGYKIKSKKKDGGIVYIYFD